MAEESKWAKYRKKDVEEWRNNGLIALGLGLLFAIGGISAAIIINLEYRDYSSSDDIRTVEATVTSVDHTSDNPKTEKDEEKWTAHYVFSIDGKEYKRYTDYSHYIAEGEKFKLTVYKTPSGDYEVPTTKSGFGTALFSIIFAVMGVAGLALAGWGVYSVLGSRKIAQALLEKQMKRQPPMP